MEITSKHLFPSKGASCFVTLAVLVVILTQSLWISRFLAFNCYSRT